MYLNFFFTLIAITFTMSANSQDITKHQWENRLLLVITSAENNPLYLEQLALFQQEPEGLEERKLLIYQVKKDAFKLGVSDGLWVSSAVLYHRYKKSKAPFEIILIGLDGGVKMRQTEVLALDKLYETIDVMPMRKK